MSLFILIISYQVYGMHPNIIFSISDMYASTCNVSLRVQFVEACLGLIYINIRLVDHLMGCMPHPNSADRNTQERS